MNITQLQSFIAAAEELHFGLAARRLGTLPSALSRNIRLLEEAVGARLFLRTTRHVTLTQEGQILLPEVLALCAQMEGLRQRFRQKARTSKPTLRLGAMDTAAAGLVPMLLRDLRKAIPELKVELVEEKTISLLPKLLSGRLDLALVRPPQFSDKRLAFALLFHETPLVAVPAGHPLAKARRLGIERLAGQPMIVPDRRQRPHSHDLTFKLFQQKGLQPEIAQVAGEKHTIVNLVASEIGLAIIPRWAARAKVPGVRYVPLSGLAKKSQALLPLAAAWAKGSRDPLRDKVLEILRERAFRYSTKA